MDKNNFINVEKLKAGLYLVATPIGNLRDISFRALDVLASADIIACEDTRVTGKLLSYFDIKGKLYSYNDHSSDKVRINILNQIESGKSVALVSDAGMPLISDPGYKLVRDAQDLGVYITSLPGANSPLTALQLSGLPSDKFCFLGFVPSKEVGRKKVFEKWKDADASLIIFESGARLVDSLSNMNDVFGCRIGVVTRELTKMYEEVRRGKLSELVDYYREHGAPKGEIVIVVEGVGEKTYGEDELVLMLKDALASMRVKDAASFVAEKTGVAKKELYEKALALKDG